MKSEVFEHPLQIIAAAGSLGNDLAKVEGCAYSGGTFSQWWCENPCVTDLDGLEIAAQIPLMYNHYNDPEYRLGVVNCTKVDGALHVSGGIDTDTERGKEIVSAGKKCEWQLSHGAEIKSAVRVPAGEKVTVNGQEFTGPLLHITKAVLREVSVVAIGADADTSLRIAAGFNNKPVTIKEQKMEETKNTPEVNAVSAAADAVQAERTRIKSVRAALKDYPTLQDKAIESGWSEEYCRDIVANIKEATAGCQNVQANIIVKKEKAADSSVLEAALSLRAGLTENDVVASYGEEIAERADRMRGISLKEALVSACQAKGISTGITLDHDTIRAAFTVTDLPNILGNVANKAMLKAYKKYPILAHKLCSIGDLPDYKEGIRAGITDFGDLEKVPVGGEVKEGAMGEESATNQIERYAKIFHLDEALIVNDDLGAFLDVPKNFGAKAARKVDRVFFTRLLSNPTFRGSRLFSAEHKNILTGTAGALSEASLKALRTLFLKQTDAAGESIAALPAFLVVPPSLEALADELVHSTTIITGEAVTRGSANVAARWGLEVVCAPYLENAAYAGNSSTGWYLFGNPDEIDTFEVAYLKGNMNPIIDKGEFDLSRFGISYRVSHHFGVREQGTAGIAFANGVN